MSKLSRAVRRHGRGRGPEPGDAGVRARAAPAGRAGGRRRPRGHGGLLADPSDGDVLYTSLDSVNATCRPHDDGKCNRFATRLERFYASPPS